MKPGNLELSNKLDSVSKADINSVCSAGLLSSACFRLFTGLLSSSFLASTVHPPPPPPFVASPVHHAAPPPFVAWRSRTHARGRIRMSWF